MKEKCNGEFGCQYSKAMGQPYPRLCIECGHPEESAIDHESLKILNTKITSVKQVQMLFDKIALRDSLMQMIEGNPYSEIIPYIDHIKCINEDIKKILNL